MDNREVKIHLLQMGIGPRDEKKSRKEEVKII